MSQSLYTAMGGISAAQTQLNVVSNNIANVNTIGFKESRVTFEDVFSTTFSAGNAPTTVTGGTNPVQVGLGVQVGAIAKNFNQGTWSSTGKTTDMMIQGNGFFAVRSSTGEVYLTKAGNFTFDSNGDMVNSQGYNVVGADKLYGTTSSSVNVHVPQKIVTNVTSNDTFGSKLLTDLNDCQLTGGTFNITLSPPSGAPTTATITLNTSTDNTMSKICASIQSQLNTKMGWDPADPTTWGATVKCDATTGGKIQVVTKPAITQSMTFVPGTSNFVLATQLGSAPLDPTTHTYSSKVLDYKVAVDQVTSLTNAQSVANYTVADDGSISATYSNGDKLTIERNPNDQTFQFKYTTSTGVTIRSTDCKVDANVAVPANFQLQLANVVNPEGLVAAGGNLFMSGPNSGDMMFTVGSAMGLGRIKAGGLEASNVDLSKQFSDMILSQRAIQANSRVFSTTSEILETLVMLGR